MPNPNVDRGCYLKLTPDEEGDHVVPHRQHGERELTFGDRGKYALRTPTETEREDIADISDFLNSLGVETSHYFDTSNPFLHRNNNFRGISGRDIDEAMDVLYEYGIRYQVLSVTPYRFLNAQTVGQLVVERPRCECTFDDHRERHEPCQHVLDGEIEGGPAEFLPTLDELREELDATIR